MSEYGMWKSGKLEHGQFHHRERKTDDREHKEHRDRKVGACLQAIRTAETGSRNIEARS